MNLGDEIYAIDADGSNARNLTRTPFNQRSPAGFPDGKLIAFYASELYLMRRHGHGVRQLTEVEGEYPSWAPDGSRLAFMSAQPGARGGNPDYACRRQRRLQRPRKLTDGAARTAGRRGPRTADGSPSAPATAKPTTPPDAPST